jgi:hypothetical protein
MNLGFIKSLETRSEGGRIVRRKSLYCRKRKSTRKMQIQIPCSHDLVLGEKSSKAIDWVSVASSIYKVEMYALGLFFSVCLLSDN